MPYTSLSLLFFILDATDTLDERTKQFFKKCLQSSAKKEWKDDQFRKIKEVCLQSSDKKEWKDDQFRKIEAVCLSPRTRTGQKHQDYI